MTAAPQTSPLGGDFSVYQVFADDSYEEVASFVSAETAVDRAHDLCHSVGGRIGTTRQVMIIDGADFAVFHWVHGLGVVFPPRPTEQEVPHVG
jgi:hypothetical protein